MSFKIGGSFFLFIDITLEESITTKLWKHNRYTPRYIVLTDVLMLSAYP